MRKPYMLLAGLLSVSAVLAVAAAVLSQAHAGDSLVQGGTPATRAIADSTLATFSHAKFTSVEIANTPTELSQAGIAPAGGLWLRINVASDEQLADAAFRTTLLADGFDSRASAAGVPRLAGYSIFVAGSASRSDLGDLVKPLPNQPQSASERTDLDGAESAINTRFTQGVRQVGGKVQSIQFSTTPRLVVEATISVPDPAAFVRNAGGLLHDIVGDDTGYDAREITVTDTAGRPVLVSTFNNVQQAGSTWIRPDLAQSSNAIYGLR